jgi:hypothetical protein
VTKILINHFIIRHKDMHTKSTFTILAVVAAMGIVTAASLVIPAMANQPVSVLEKKDAKVHEHQGFLSKQDIKFHEQTCFPPQFGGTFPNCPHNGNGRAH